MVMTTMMQRAIRFLLTGTLLAMLAVAAPPRVAHAQDAAELLLRLDKLEAENRRLNGQIEQLQFQTRRQEDQLKRFQADADLRFKDLEGGKPASPRPAAPPTVTPQKRSEADELYPTAPVSPQVGAASSGGYLGTPANIASSTAGLAPGPRPLGSGTGTLSDRPVRPSVNPNASIIDDEAPVPLSRSPGGAPPRYTPGQTASIPTGSAKDVFEVGRGALDRGEFAQAELAFREFLRAHPKDRLVPEATFGLGESYFSRRKYTEAAEQYLNLTTQYGQSARAPEGMLKLGMSLRALGSAQEACATLGEVLRRYPNANGSVKAAVSRERSRAKCAG